MSNRNESSFRQRAIGFWQYDPSMDRLRALRNQAQSPQAGSTTALPGMLSSMHAQSNLSERPPAQDGYQPITDESGEIRLGAERKNRVYTNITFYKGFIPSVDFSHSRFALYMRFQHANGTSAHFSHCDLPYARFSHAVLNGTKFDHARLTRAEFEGAKLGQVDKIQPLFLPIARDSSSSFARLFPLFTPRLSQPLSHAASFQNADLSHASFKSAEMEGCDLRDADLSDANFEDANLKKADLRGKNLPWASLAKAKNLSGTKIDLRQCIEDELRADKPRAAKMVVKLAELSVNQGLNLGMDNTRLSDSLAEIFHAVQEGKTTTRQLEQDFRHYYQKAEKLVHYREMSPDEYLPYIFRQIQHKLENPELVSDSSETET